MALKVSQPAISKALPGLEKEDLIFVAKDKASKRLSISLNRKNPFVIGLKRADNLKLLYESGMVPFLYDRFPEATISLFGSFSFGEDVAESDIDIAVVGAKEKDVDLERFNTSVGKTINLNFYQSWEEIDRHLRNNILNGIILKGQVAL